MKCVHAQDTRTNSLHHGRRAARSQPRGHIRYKSYFHWHLIFNHAHAEAIRRTLKGHDLYDAKAIKTPIGLPWVPRGQDSESPATQSDTKFTGGHFHVHGCCWDHPPSRREMGKIHNIVHLHRFPVQNCDTTENTSTCRTSRHGSPRVCEKYQWPVPCVDSF